MTALLKSVTMHKLHLQYKITVLSVHVLLHRISLLEIVNYLSQLYHNYNNASIHFVQVIISNAFTLQYYVCDIYLAFYTLITH